MNKVRIKKVLEEEIFSHNPFNDTVIDRTLNRVYENRQTVTNKKRKVLYHVSLTICACFIFIIGGILYFGNANEFAPNGKSEIDNKMITNDTEDEEIFEQTDETKDEIILLAEEVLTNNEALEEFLKLPKVTQRSFNEFLLHRYNEDPDFREKVSLGIEKANNLSTANLENLSIKIPKNNYVAEFNDHGDKVIIIGEEWKSLREEFQTLEQHTQQQILTILSEIGREFVISNGELAIPENQGVFKSSETWKEVPELVKERVYHDVERKLSGLETLLDNIKENLLIYESLQGYKNSYNQIMTEELTNQKFIEYLGINFRFFIFSYMLLEPRPVEVLAEPEYLTNKEQVDIVLH